MFQLDSLGPPDYKGATSGWSRRSRTNWRKQMSTYNLRCYRTEGTIPADLGVLVAGLKAGALRLGQRVGQVCLTAGESLRGEDGGPANSDEMVAHRKAAAETNPGILTSAGLAPLLTVWKQAGALKAPEAADLFAATMQAAGPQVATAPVAAPKPVKPPKAPKPVKVGPPTLAAVLEVQAQAPAAPVAVVAKPVKVAPVPVAAPVAATFGAPVVITADTIRILAALAQAVAATGTALPPISLGGTTYTVHP